LVGVNGRATRDEPENMTKADGLRAAAAVAVLGLLVFAWSAAHPRALQSGVALTQDSKDSVTYFIADGKKSVGYRPGDRELALWAFQSWERNAGKGLHFEPAAESVALIRLYWAEPGGGEYGETQPLLVHGRRGAAVFIRPDVESLGPDIARRAAADDLLRDTIVYLTCLHELGHALGLDHTRDFRDIMFFFGYGGDIVEYFGRYRSQLHTRNDIATVSGLSDSDVARIRAIYARE
jgi:Matrixin